jgi:Delta3,5-Delta2,4-dienoyl-CoA isomerase
MCTNYYIIVIAPTTTTYICMNMNMAFKTVPHSINDHYEFIEISICPDAAHVAIVRLDRPRKRNALNATMWSEIGRVFREIGSLGDGCRCILLSGNGSAFCSGIDVNDPSLFQFPHHNVAHSGIAFLAKLKDMQDCFTALELCSVPVVAAIHGCCIGGGIDLMCAAGVRLCHPDTVFSVREVALGLAAAVGTLQRLPKIAGNSSLVNELCLTGREFSAEEALQMGMVSRVTENVFIDALALCSIISCHSPVAVHGTKKALLYARDHSVADGLDQIGAFNSLALQGQDVQKGFTALTRKQKPTYSNIPAFSRL